jgi:hypothetical protein|tara:strand:- start:24 stop:155 length:132 start_codon:yes stop_codon:yes gene_type:complete
MGKDFTTKGTGKGKMPQGGESAKQERKNLTEDNPIAKKASGKY